MADKKGKAVSELKNGLAKFKAEAMKKGFEKDEVEEKISEVFENFPWYKFTPVKRTWKSKIWNIVLYSFILYLACLAAMERSETFNKAVTVFMFDNQISYHQQRIVRFLSLPLFKFYDLSKYHSSDCLISNPFVVPEDIECTFCEGIDSIAKISLDSVDLQNMIKAGEPFVVDNVPGYVNSSITFNGIKKTFLQHKEDMDDGICVISETTKFATVSDYFKLTEEEVKEQSISIGWTNCHTSGTRYYRRIFTRPSFISNSSEIYFEKSVYILQPGYSLYLLKSGGESGVLAQMQGESVFSIGTPSDCHTNCTSVPIVKTLKKGDIVVFPTNGWKPIVNTTGDAMSILYLSFFT